jgi:uncharacterized protein YkwD
MKKKGVLLVLSIFFNSILYATFAQSTELIEAFNYLNNVRANPGKFSDEIGVNLRGIKSIHALRWNENLAAAAQNKAEDMANRDYFDHVNPEGYGMNYFINYYGYSLNASWIEKKSSNYFESISAGARTPKEAIINLIDDGGETVHLNAGHRVHLLGLKDFYQPCYDIGIGWAYNPNSTYRYYCCVLIAKHDY